MQIITSDKIGLLKYVQCGPNSSISEQTLQPDLRRTINHVTWSGGYGGYEESQITLCRKNGLVESFPFWYDEPNPNISDTCLLSFLSCNNCIYTRMLNQHHSVIYKDLLAKEKERYINYAQFMPIYTSENVKNGVYENYLQNDRLLLTVSNGGHVHVLNWNCDNERSKYHLSKEDEMKHKDDATKRRQLYFKNYKEEVLQCIEFKQIEEKNSHNNVIIKKNEYANVRAEDICTDYHFDNMLSEEAICHSYILSNPIDAACVNEVLTNRLAIGGYRNSLKVFDLFTGTYMWKSKNIGTTLLNLNCESLIKSVNFLDDINVNILSASTYDHKIVLYDMRCQAKPVYVYDHYKRGNISKNKFSSFDHNYSESDLVFTCISSSSHVWREEKAVKEEPKTQEGEVEVAKEQGETQNGETNQKTEEDKTEKERRPRQLAPQPHCAEEELHTKFNAHQVKANNFKMYEKLQQQKRGENEATGVNQNGGTQEKRDASLSPPKDPNESHCCNYFIKKFASKDSQIIFVSDNYGNVYKFEVVTGNKLLQYIYIKKCAQEKVTCEEEKKGDPSFLLKNKQSLYEFYKEYQSSNKTHMRNDLPVMWAKDNFDQFLILFLNKFKIHNGAISSLSLHRGGIFLCSVSYDRFLSILNLEMKKVVKRLHIGHILTSCLFRSLPIDESEHAVENGCGPKAFKRQKVLHPAGESEDEPSSECESWQDSSNESIEGVSKRGKRRQGAVGKAEGEDDEDEEDDEDDEDEEDDEDDEDEEDDEDDEDEEHDEEDDDNDDDEDDDDDKFDNDDDEDDDDDEHDDDDKYDNDDDKYDNDDDKYDNDDDKYDNDDDNGDDDGE
ncbi:hypothetical protein C922_04414 [Plasmodium inui San Antonio 1]|uniref:Uncharacterized protein n=1 Tax=Plasmodium inui San Antonio 1 TaxID=1237626 RepID=W7A0X5_9APIC|nr:hypothetical protein C922_04414 [Plasmodium inui San Antonio 1]EUD65285.1 hypothetical protein C922_04414 [Plasmodium inui San Antonio 1]